MTKWAPSLRTSFESVLGALVLSKRVNHPGQPSRALLTACSTSSSETCPSPFGSADGQALTGVSPAAIWMTVRRSLTLTDPG